MRITVCGAQGVEVPIVVVPLLTRFAGVACGPLGLHAVGFVLGLVVDAGTCFQQLLHGGGLLHLGQSAVVVDAQATDRGRQSGLAFAEGALS